MGTSLGKPDRTMKSALGFLFLFGLLTSPLAAQGLSTDKPSRSWPLERYLVAVLGIPFEGTSPYLVVELRPGDKALFRSEEGDEPWGSQAEIAGYRMACWLGWPDLVPVTVPRRLGREDFPDGEWP